MPKVMIDPGHGGKDSGAVAFGLKEKDMNLVTAFAVRDELNRHGVQTNMTRTTDVFIELSQRARLANNWGADLFVSCHYNAGGGDGAEVIHSVVGGEGEKLADKILARIKSELGQNFHGSNPSFSRRGSDGGDYHAVVRETHMTGVIVEPGFIDSSDRILFDTEAEQRKSGIVIAHGILDLLGIPVKGGEAPAQTPSQPTPAPAPKPAGILAVVQVTAENLNIRSGPGTKYPSIGKAPKDRMYNVIANQNDWHRVILGDGDSREAWIFGNNGQYLNMLKQF